MAEVVETSHALEYEEEDSGPWVTRRKVETDVHRLARHLTHPVRLKHLSPMFDLCGKHTQVMSFCYM